MITSQGRGKEAAAEEKAEEYSFIMASKESNIYPIPGVLNIAIALCSYAAALGFLTLASRASTWGGALLWALAFSFVGNTIFSLLHESVHRIFSSSRRVNDAFGQLSAMFFPTGFQFQRAFHLGHHRRNRTDLEMFDMYYPGDNRILKFVQLYSVLLGFYWTSAPIGGLLFLFFPALLNHPWLRSKDPDIQHLSADAMLSGLDKLNPASVRKELLLSLCFHVALFLTGWVSFTGWILCYWAFALHWGSLQYADHAWSPRDIRNGAWNLRVNLLSRLIFLNYHHHRVHHQSPKLSWIHLGKMIDPAEPRPSHFGIWLRMWRGPTLTHEPSPPELTKNFEEILYQ